MLNINIFINEHYWLKRLVQKGKCFLVHAVWHWIPKNCFTLGKTLWRFQHKDISIGEMVGAWCFWLLSGPRGFTCWISVALVFSFMHCWILIFALSPFYVLINMFKQMMQRYVRGLSFKPSIYVSWSKDELRVRLAPWNRFKPSSKSIFTGCSNAVLLLWIVWLVDLILDVPSTIFQLNRNGSSWVEPVFLG